MDLVLPPRCVHCDDRLIVARPAVCGSCLSALVEITVSRCDRCGLVLNHRGLTCWRCRDWPPELVAIAAVPYRGVAEAIVHAMKYEGYRHLADLCAERMADAVRSQGHRLDILVPMPLHPLRYRERGFNQSRLIADRLAPKIERPVVDALRRVRTTPPQVGRGRAARVANVSGAFACRTSIDKWVTVGLIDDVATSGATLEAAARELIAAGAGRVIGVTFALATGRNDG